MSYIKKTDDEIVWTGGDCSPVEDVWVTAKLWRDKDGRGWGYVVDADFVTDMEGQHPYYVDRPLMTSDEAHRTKEAVLIQLVATLVSMVDELQGIHSDLQAKILKGVDQADDIPLLLRRVADRIERRGK